MRWAKGIACMGARRNMYNIFIGKPQERSSKCKTKAEMRG
jgi:hypothetical protein